MVLFIAFLSGVYVQSLISKQEDRYSIQPYVEKAKAIKKEADARASFQNRVQKVKTFLADRGSPLTNYAESFVTCADRYGLHPGLLVGITGAESSYGKFYGLRNNPYNYGIYLRLGFDNVADATCHVAQKLRENYDLTSPYTIAVKYAPAADKNNPIHWAKVVQDAINQL